MTKFCTRPKFCLIILKFTPRNKQFSAPKFWNLLNFSRIQNFGCNDFSVIPTPKISLLFDRIRQRCLTLLWESRGWEVKYSIEDDENNKPKADNVNAVVVGGFCDSHRRKRAGKSKEGNRAPQPRWHELLREEAKDALGSKGISRSTGTLDLALVGVRCQN